MKPKQSFYVCVVSPILMLCLLSLQCFAQSSGLADSNALAYDKALSMLTTSSLTDGNKLQDIHTQFIQVGSYQFGLEYMTFVEALIILQGEDANRLDDALDIIRRLSKNEGFTSDYYGHHDKSPKPILPNLERLIQYVGGRKLEAYGDREAAIAEYDAYPVLDAIMRAGKLTSMIKKENYDKASELLLEGSPTSIQQAADIFEVLGDYRDSARRFEECRQRIPSTLVPSSEVIPTQMLTKEEPMPTPIAAVNVPIYYVDSYGTILFTDYITFTVGRYVYSANDAFVPTGYTLSGSRSITVTVSTNGISSPANITFIYISPKSSYEQPIAVGSIISFGKYEQDNNTSNGTEEIPWKVLAVENGKALLLSQYNLDCQPYNNQEFSVTWETCTLRTWLNVVFLNAAFTQTQREAIAVSTLMNGNNGRFDTFGGALTQDRVFILSDREARQYLNGNASRIAKNTVYAKAQGVYTRSDGTGWWWLRSPGSSNIVAAHVTLSGTIYLNGVSVSLNSGAVRPALWVDLSSGLF